MADTDMIDVIFLKQRVYHDGTSMIVAKEGDERQVKRSQVAGLIAEGAIEEPEGWADELAVASLPRADGGPVFTPSGQFAAPQPGSEATTDLPSLAGKKKAGLLRIAKKEGVEVADKATIPQIKDAIEAKRAAAAADSDEAPAA